MEVQTLQTQREEQVKELQAKVQAVQSCSQEEAAELGSSLRALESRREQEASALQETLGEAEKSAELSNALVEDMQKQIDELNHEKAKLEVLFICPAAAPIRPALRAAWLLCMASSQDGRMSQGTGTVLRQHAYLQEEAEHLRLALSKRNSFLEERSRALTAKHAELEDKHADVLMDLRQKEDKVGCCLQA